MIFGGLRFQDAIREAQGVQQIVKAMTTHAGHVDVQENACKILATISDDNYDNQVPPIILLSGDGVEKTNFCCCCSFKFYINITFRFYISGLYYVK
jgi:hypothetical protein